MDSYTKWAKAFAIKNKEAKTIAKVLVEQVFTRFGCPLSILSDQGKEVNGGIMRKVCRLFGIEKLRTTSYKPSTNQIECFHRTLNSILAKTVADHQKNWDTQLPYAMAAFRATRHEATGYSPNFLVLIREVQVPVDLMYGAPNETPAEDYDAFVEQVRDRTTTFYEQICQQLRRSAERNKHYYDISLKPKRFSVGQWFLYFNPRKFRGKQMKWQRQYGGPYLVVATPTPLTVKIQRNAKAQVKVVHVDKLKEYLGTPPRSWLSNQTMEDLSPPSTPTQNQTGSIPENPNDKQLFPSQRSPDQQDPVHLPAIAENFDQTDNTSIQLSANAEEFDLDEQTTVKQRIDMSCSHESPRSTVPVTADCEYVSRRGSHVEHSIVRGNAEGGRPGRSRRTLARYRNFCMKGRGRGRRATEKIFQTAPKCVGSVRFSSAITQILPQKPVIPRLIVITNSGVS